MKYIERTAGGIMPVDFNYFNALKDSDSIVWEQVRQWRKGKGAVSYLSWSGKRRIGGKLEDIPGFFFHLSVDKDGNKVGGILAANVAYNMAGTGQKPIDAVPMGSLSAFEDGTVEEIMASRYGIKGGTLQRHNVGRYNPALPPKYQKAYRTLINDFDNKVKTVYLNEVAKGGKTAYVVRMVTFDSATGKFSPDAPDIRVSVSDTLEEGSVSFAKTVRELETAGYVEIGVYGEKAPEWTRFNFNSIFSPEAQEHIQNQYWGERIDEMLSEDDRPEDEDSKTRNPLHGSSMPWPRSAQLGPTGKAPDIRSLVPKIGTPDVDASQVEAVFPGSRDAIGLVNQLRPGLLTSIAWIYNSSGNAFGVYVPAVDWEIEKNEAELMMNNMGYRTEPTPDGKNFVAYPKDPKVPMDKVQHDLKGVYDKIKLQGGKSLGINVKDVLDASQQDINDLQVTDPWEQHQIRVIHLAATMVHEATHARGDQGEGGPKAAEIQFMQEALARLNNERKTRWKGPPEEFKEFKPDPSRTRQAEGGGWYRRAQYGAQFSVVTPWWSHQPMAGMAMGQSGSIESMLQSAGRGGDSAVGPLEKRLEKNRNSKWNEDNDTGEHTEDLLSKDRESLEAYKHVEKLMEDTRPKPLMTPVKKEASIIRLAYSMLGYMSHLESLDNTWGWYSNLDLPWRERVIPKEDSEEFLNFDWGEEGRSNPGTNNDMSGQGGSVAGQPRYNPEEDEYKGVFYQWKDLQRNSPELWEDMVSERPSRVNPAARFGAATEPGVPAEDDDVQDTVREVAEVMGQAEALIGAGVIRGTRFLLTEDMIDPLKMYFHGSGLRLISFTDAGRVSGNDLVSVWVTDKATGKDEVVAAERFARGETGERDAEEAFDSICGLSEVRGTVITKILHEASVVAKENGIEDIYVVGGLPRAMEMREPLYRVKDIDFSSTWPDQCVKLGGILAERLGVQDAQYYHRTMTLTWEWNDVRCDFRGSMAPRALRELMREKGIKTTPLNMDVYGRDLTINMLVMDLAGGVHDICGASKDDIESGLLRTFFRADAVVPGNPLVILRTMKYAARYGFRIDPELEAAMKEHMGCLFDGTISEERLAAGAGDILSEGRDKADSIIRRFGLERLYDVMRKVKEEQDANSTQA